MNWASLMNVIARIVPGIPSRQRPEHRNEQRQTRETVERARRVVDVWNQRNRDTWRADGPHARRG